MSGRQRNAALSAENERFVSDGYYVHPSSRSRVDISSINDAKRRVVYYSPEDSLRVFTDQFQALNLASTKLYTTKIQVTPETSTAAAARLHLDGHHPVVLNYASATKPGGGYLSGARAQEEDLCRSSALYTCLMTVEREFYGYHRKNKDGRYSHRFIWTPDVPVFRSSEGRLLQSPYPTSFITAAAPNAGALAVHNPSAVRQCREILAERAARVLGIAAEHGARTLVLGAWGCGVFKNDPADVADIFRSLLSGPYAGRFEMVVFAVYDTSRSGETLRAFESAFPVGPNITHLDPEGVRARALVDADSNRQPPSSSGDKDRREPGSDVRERAAQAATARMNSATSSAANTKPMPNGTLDAWLVRK